jgi:hypothetical protein
MTSLTAQIGDFASELHDISRDILARNLVLTRESLAESCMTARLALARLEALSVLLPSGEVKAAPSALSVRKEVVLA